MATEHTLRLRAIQPRLRPGTITVRTPEARAAKNATRRVKKAVRRERTRKLVAARVS